MRGLQILGFAAVLLIGCSQQAQTNSPVSNNGAPQANAILTVRIDRNQVNYYAVASAPTADFRAETVACANQGKEMENERYCYVFPTRKAFDASGVDPRTGEMEEPCWVAFGGSGVGRAGAVAAEIAISPRWEYDSQNRCPPF